MFILPLHLLWCEVYVNIFGYGFEGVAYASLTTNCLEVLLIVLFVRIKGDQEVK